jgi:hypothetical protein
LNTVAADAPRLGDKLWVLLVLVAGGLLGVGLVVNTLITAVLFVGLVGGLCAWLLALRTNRPFVLSLAALLVGYTIFGRGLAYVGVGPVRVGEAVFFLGLTSLLVGKRLVPVLTTKAFWIFGLFGVWGLTRTLPFVGEFGQDALRDAVIWGYALFALALLAACLEKPEILGAIRRWYPWVLNLIVFTAPIGLGLAAWRPDLLPRVGPGVEGLEIRPADLSVHLGAAATFVLLGLGTPLGSGLNARGRLLRIVWWTSWLAGIGLATSASRAGMLAVCACFLLTGLRIPVRRWAYPISIGVLGITLSLGLGLGRFAVKADRVVGAEQLAENIKSLFGKSSQRTAENTTQWRLEWWERIVDNTILSKGHALQGEGFGPEIWPPFESDVDKPPLRSPHNISMTFLARSGLVGLLLWISVQSLFAFQVSTSIFREFRARRSEAAIFGLWILGYWTAFLVSASFSVQIESPQGGIWFWSVIGAGLAFAELSRSGRLADVMSSIGFKSEQPSVTMAQEPIGA